MRSGRSASPSTSDEADARFGARALLAGLALVLVAVPFSLLLFLVLDKWRPLARLDSGARDSLHDYAVTHQLFVTVMKVLSTIGSAPVYLTVFAAMAGWLFWRRLPGLAVFVVVTLVGSSVLNALVKLAVNRSRPVLPDPVAHAGG